MFLQCNIILLMIKQRERKTKCEKNVKKKRSVNCEDVRVCPLYYNIHITYHMHSFCRLNCQFTYDNIVCRVFFPLIIWKKRNESFFFLSTRCWYRGYRIAFPRSRRWFYCILCCKFLSNLTAITFGTISIQICCVFSFIATSRLQKKCSFKWSDGNRIVRENWRKKRRKKQRTKKTCLQNIIKIRMSSWYVIWTCPLVLNS